ncbi:MAG TPA: MFS transporter [Burkholderiales bacterium]|nr:MFS transporter [Burkholderiales bacterium]
MSKENQSQFRLLRERRFAPFFLTQFFGAFNDNVYKNALVILVAYHAAEYSSLDPNLLTNAAAGLFILPFVLFSASAGQLADKFEKSGVIRAIKAFEVGIMLVGSAGLLLHNLPLLFAALFLLGLHSTLFGPIKYAILPQALHPAELVGGNGLVEMGTFIAILAGTLVAGVLVSLDHGVTLVCAMILAVGVAGLLSSFAIPKAPPAAAELVFDWNPARETWKNLKFAKRNRTVFLSLLGISWFWFYGATFLTQFPNYSKLVLGGNEHVVTMLLALFSVGVAAGSLLCERLSGHKVEIGLVPFGSIGLSVFAVDLFLATPSGAGGAQAGAYEFIMRAGSWRVVLDLFLIGMFGGFYIVPLYALIQTRSAPTHRSRIIAANNILNALFMVVATGLAAATLGAGMTIPQLLLLTGVLNAFVALYIYLLVPEFLLRFVDWLLVHSIYRLKTSGTSHIPEEGPALLVCNHQSLADALIITAACRRPIRFVMYYAIFEVPVLNFLFRAMKAIPIAGSKESPEVLEQAYESIAAALSAGELVCIFPEGQLTRDGSIGPFRPGVARILERTPVPVVPMALSGLWRSIFSRNRDKWKAATLFPSVSLAAGPALGPSVSTPESLRAAVVRLHEGEAPAALR